MVQWSNVFACKSRKVYIPIFRWPLFIQAPISTCLVELESKQLSLFSSSTFQESMEFSEEDLYPSLCWVFQVLDSQCFCLFGSRVARSWWHGIITEMVLPTGSREAYYGDSMIEFIDIKCRLLISFFLYVEVSQLLLCKIMVFIAEFICFTYWNTEEIHQVLSLLFVYELLAIEGDWLYLFSNFIRISMAHLELLEHLVHVSLWVFIAFVNSLLGKFNVSLDFIARNRRNIVVWRHLLE